MYLRWLVRWLLLFIMLAGLLALAACGDDDEGGDGATPEATEEADGGGGEIDISGVQELEDGVLTIGSDIAYAPIEFYQEGTETRLASMSTSANAMAENMGVEAEFLNTAALTASSAASVPADYDIIDVRHDYHPRARPEIDFIPYLERRHWESCAHRQPGRYRGSRRPLRANQSPSRSARSRRNAGNTQQPRPCDNPIEFVTFATTRLPSRICAPAARTPTSPTSRSRPKTPEESRRTSMSVEPQASNPAPYGIGVRKDVYRA